MLIVGHQKISSLSINHVQVNQRLEYMTTQKLLLPLVSAFLLGACGGGSDSSEDLTIDNTGDGTDVTNPVSTGESSLSYRTGFPSTMLIGSPLKADSSLDNATSKVSYSTHSTAYESMVDQLSSLLSGDTDFESVFDLGAFFALSSDASCYGPQLAYQDHPDALDSNDDGTLPTGDLGIWVETQDSGEACAAAQLNARLTTVENRVLMSMIAMGGLILAYESDGNVWPDDIQTNTSSGDLSTVLNAFGMSDVSFQNAEIFYDVTNGQYEYELGLTVTRDSADYDVYVSLIYDPQSDEEDSSFESVLNLLIEDEFINPSDDCGDDLVTHNVSLHFQSQSESDVRLQNREASLCGHFDLDTASVSNGLTLSTIDESLSSAVTAMVLNPDTDPDGDATTLDGWQNNFAYFTADFNPSNMRGDYSYVWQAGPQDSHSRILNLGLEVTDGTVGESYFGYGDTVDTLNFDHLIKGFICNWAGPGNDHTLVEHAQRQHITFNSSSELYEPSNSNGSSSNITYAPTVSCEYDGSGTFVYDRDLDGDLSDETSDTVNIGVGQTLSLDLVEDAANQYDGIDDYIVNGRGYDLPDYPL